MDSSLFSYSLFPEQKLPNESIISQRNPQLKKGDEIFCENHKKDPYGLHGIWGVNSFEMNSAIPEFLFSLQDLCLDPPGFPNLSPLAKRDGDGIDNLAASVLDGRLDNRLIQDVCRNLACNSSSLEYVSKDSVEYVTHGKTGSKSLDKSSAVCRNLTFRSPSFAEDGCEDSFAYVTNGIFENTSALTFASSSLEGNGATAYFTNKAIVNGKISECFPARKCSDEVCQVQHHEQVKTVSELWNLLEKGTVAPYFTNETMVYGTELDSMDEACLLQGHGAMMQFCSSVERKAVPAHFTTEGIAYGTKSDINADEAVQQQHHREMMELCNSIEGNGGLPYFANEGNNYGEKYGGMFAKFCQYQHQHHDAMRLVLMKLSLRDLFAVEGACKSLRAAVREDLYLWSHIRIEDPLSFRMKDGDLLGLSERGKGKLHCLTLVECHYITDTTMKQIVQYNPKLKKISLLGCTGITTQGVIEMINAAKFHADSDDNDKFGLKHLFVSGVNGLSPDQVADFKELLSSALHGPGDLVNQFDQLIEVEICSTCQRTKIIYNFPGENCHGEEVNIEDFQDCILCLPVCHKCQSRIRNNEYEETFSLEIMCSICYHQTNRCSRCLHGNHVGSCSQDS